MSRAWATNISSSCVPPLIHENMIIVHIIAYIMHWYQKGIWFSGITLL